MKNILLALTIFFPVYANAGGGRNFHVPDNFFKVIEFVIFLAVIIHLVKKLDKN